MIEIYCDASFREGLDSYMGFLVFKDEIQISELTEKIIPNPKGSTLCERMAIKRSIQLSDIFAEKGEEVIIYNDCKSVVDSFSILQLPDNICIKGVRRKEGYQGIADKFSKGYFNGIFSHRQGEDKKISSNSTVEIYYELSNKINGMYFGFLVRKNGEEVHQSTTKFISQVFGKENVESTVQQLIEKFSNIFSEENFDITIKNNQKQEVPIKVVTQLAERCLHFDRILPEFYKCEIDSFDEITNSGIDPKKCIFFFVKKEYEESCNKSIYKLKACFSGKSYDIKHYSNLSRGGKGVDYMVAEEIHQDFNDPEFQLHLKSKELRLDSVFFVLTKEMTRFLIGKQLAARVLPESIEHKIIDGIHVNPFSKQFNSRPYLEGLFKELSH